jgi:hypothetical protein
VGVLGSEWQSPRVCLAQFELIKVRDLSIFQPNLHSKERRARSSSRQEMEEQGRLYLNVELFNIDGEKLFATNRRLTSGEEAKWTANSVGILGAQHEGLEDLLFVAGLVSREIPLPPSGPVATRQG